MSRNQRHGLIHLDFHICLIITVAAQRLDKTSSTLSNNVPPDHKARITNEVNVVVEQARRLPIPKTTVSCAYLSVR